MKNILFYFSATGNTLAITRKLAENLGSTTCIPIKHDTMTKIPEGTERIGFMFPVYAWGMPLLVKNFMQRLDIAKQTYLFSVVTCGSSIGATILQADRLLRQKGLFLSAGFRIPMPGNCITLYNVCSPDKQKEKCERAYTIINQITPAIREKTQIDSPKGPWLFNAIFSGLIYRSFAWYVHKADTYFNTTDDCNGCALCAKICPAGNIRIENRLPVWLHKCEQCLACLHWCPQQAIQYKNRTKTRNRYHHPDLELKDMI